MLKSSQQDTTSAPRHDRPNEICRQAHAGQTPHIQRPHSQTAKLQLRPKAQLAAVGTRLLSSLSDFLASERFILFLTAQAADLISTDPATASDSDCSAAETGNSKPQPSFRKQPPRAYLAPTRSPLQPQPQPQPARTSP